MRAIYRKSFLILSIFIFGLATPAMSDESKIPEPFRGETRSSPISINYDDWSRILRITVFDAGMSDRSFASAPKPQVGTRITRGNASITRHEGNRLVFPAFVDNPDNLAMISEIRQELEAIPDQVPMREWSEKEQLAYWLNLYNITLIEMISREYPVKSLRKLWNGSRKEPSLWDRKALKVAGIDLSLNDIRSILVNKWDSTLVMYGLFQGYVGGPSIQKAAYTADNVHAMLVKNAREFVNSNRGMRLKGSTLEISTLYNDYKSLFPNWEEDLKKHFVSLTDPEYHARIKGAKSVKAKTSDYYIADLFDGTKAVGYGANTNSAALMSAEVHGLQGITGGSEGINNITMDNYGSFRDTATLDLRFPPHVQDYVTAIRKKQSQKEGTVELEELGTVDENGQPN